MHGYTGYTCSVNTTSTQYIQDSYRSTQLTQVYVGLLYTLVTTSLYKGVIQTYTLVYAGIDNIQRLLHIRISKGRFYIQCLQGVHKLYIGSTIHRLYTVYTSIYLDYTGYTRYACFTGLNSKQAYVQGLYRLYKT